MLNINKKKRNELILRSVLNFYKNEFDDWVNDLLSIMASEVELLHLNNSIDFMNRVAILRNNQNIEIM